MDSELYILFFLGFRHYLGKALNLEWRTFKHQWRAKNGWPKHCQRCGVRTKKPINEFDNLHNYASFDHIIPRSIINELELFELLFDYDNFAYWCHKCNAKKGNKLPDTQDLSPELLTKFYAAVDRRNAENVVYT